MNIEITALEAGSLVVFTMAVLGMVMALRVRKIRKYKKEVKKEKDWKASKAKTTETYEFKTNPETLAPKKVLKEPENPEHEKPKHDVDALLDDLKKDSEK